MNVKNIADTYTNLGRMGRGQPKLPGPGEDFPLHQPTADDSGIQPELLEIKPTKPGLRQEEALSLKAAMALTQNTVESILESPEPSALNLHDVLQVHMIPGRYV